MPWISCLFSTKITIGKVPLRRLFNLAKIIQSHPNRINEYAHEEYSVMQCTPEHYISTKSQDLGRTSFLDGPIVLCCCGYYSTCFNPIFDEIQYTLHQEQRLDSWKFNNDSGHDTKNLQRLNWFAHTQEVFMVINPLNEERAGNLNSTLSFSLC